MAVEPLELLGDVEEPGDGGVVGAHLLQLGLRRDGVRQTDGIGRVVGHQLADPVDLTIGHAKHAPDVAQRRAGLQLSEGDDLGDPAAAVFLLDVGDDLVAAVLAEVDVEVGHGHPVGVEETLEQETEAQRVEVGDGERPGHHRAGARPPARPHRDVVAFGPFDEIGDDQEVAGIAHIGDHAEFVFEALAVRPCRLLAPGFVHGGGEDMGLQTPLQPLFGLASQRLGLGHAVGDREGGQDRASRRELEGAALGHHQGVVGGFRQIGEQRPHLPRRLEAMLGRQLAPGAVGDEGALGDADQRVVGLEHPGVGEEGLVGRHQWHLVFIGEVEKPSLDPFLDLQPMARHLDIEPAREQRLEPGEPFTRPLVLVLGEKPADDAAGPAGQRDQPVRGAVEVVQRHPGDAAGLGVEIGLAEKLDQMVIAGLVLDQDDELVGFGRAAGAAGAG